ncbi:MAG: hypothetical protein U0235_12050 [Polyangiaceae bacterium]
MSEAHWADQLALRKPALVILQYGTNESEDRCSSPRATRSSSAGSSRR